MPNPVVIDCPQCAVCGVIGDGTNLDLIFYRNFATRKALCIHCVEAAHSAITSYKFDQAGKARPC